MPLGRIRAWPSCTVACGPRPQRRLGPCAHRTRPTVCRVGLGLRGAARGAAGGGATMAEVEQRKALEHPRRRGHPLGMWVEAIAHRSFSSTGKGGNRIGGGVLRWGERSGGRRRSYVRVEGERKLGSTIHGWGVPLMSAIFELNLLPDENSSK
jgi:hypothetical protein